MLRKLNLRLTIIYGLIIIITIIAVDSVLFYTYEKNQFDKNESKFLSYGNILSNVVRGNMNDILSLNRTIKNYSQSLEGRVLVLNTDKMVLDFL